MISKQVSEHLMTRHKLSSCLLLQGENVENFHWKLSWNFSDRFLINIHQQVRNIHIWPKIGDPALFDYENKNMWLEIFLKASYLINGLGFLVNNSILFSTD